MQEDPNNTTNASQDVTTSFGPQADAIAQQHVGREVPESQVVVDAAQTAIGTEAETPTDNSSGSQTP